MSDKQPLLVHDTIRVLYANDQAGSLFRCGALALVDRYVLDLIVSDDFRTLAKIHMKILHEQGEAPAIEYPFVRCDATVFWAMTSSGKFDDGIFAMFLKKTFEEWW